MRNKLKNYLIILGLCGMIGVTFYYVGANRGHDMGFKHGIADFILYGATVGTIECKYVRKK